MLDALQISRPSRALRRTGPLLLFASSLWLFACDAKPPAHEGPWTGAELFQRELCTSCHGLGREGSWMGPPLHGLGEHWDRETLADFIRTPTIFTAQDERLAALSRQFRAPMADHPVLGKADRLTLADWLLAGEGNQ